MVLFFVGMQIAARISYSDELDDITKQINDLQKSLEMSINATTPLESRVTGLKSQITGIENRVIFLENDIAKKRKNINDGYNNLAAKQEILHRSIRNYYIKQYSYSPFLVFISTEDAADLTRMLVYQKKSTDQDKAIITTIAITITDLETRKTKLESEEKRLAHVKSQLAVEKVELEKIVKGAKEYQATLTTKIAELNAKQQEIIAQRSGSFTATIGDSELADDYNASIKGFRESAPAGSFAAFSFGAHTHRKGMSQYGARGRAQNGQSYRDILKAYYGKEPVTKDTGGNISVSGYGDMDFETTYLYGIAEMPSTWHKEALKAQAVAARTYAYRYKAQGQSICTTEACQVFSKSKSDSRIADWVAAVDETRGQVLEDVITYYASTHGGFASPIGWDTNDGGGGGNFIDKAYDKIGASPWVYKAWYTKGYSPSSDKCGRSSPWLSETEMADIINAYYVLNGSGGGADTGRVTPVTTSCWGGNPYSNDELRNVSQSYGGGINSATGVQVLQGNGTTNEVIFQTDKGEKRISGSKFKETFNLRAPGYLSIPQSEFAFYNIEKK